MTIRRVFSLILAGVMVFIPLISFYLLVTDLFDNLHTERRIIAGIGLISYMILLFIINTIFEREG